MYTKNMFFCPYVYTLKDRRTEEQKIKEQRGDTQKTYVLMFLCLHFKRQKNKRTKD